MAASSESEQSEEEERSFAVISCGGGGGSSTRLRHSMFRATSSGKSADVQCSVGLSVERGNKQTSPPLCKTPRRGEHRLPRVAQRIVVEGKEFLSKEVYA